MPTLRDITLSVSAGKIQIDPDSQKAQAGDVVRFISATPNTTFEIAIHNFDQFFTDSRTIIVDPIPNGTPITYTVDNSDNLVRYYSICVPNQNPPPRQPDAPPRIIRY